MLWNILNEFLAKTQRVQSSQRKDMFVEERISRKGAKNTACISQLAKLLISLLGKKIKLNPKTQDQTPNNDTDERRVKKLNG